MSQPHLQHDLDIHYLPNAGAQAFESAHKVEFEAWARANSQTTVHYRGSDGRFNVARNVVLDQIVVINGLHAAGQASTVDIRTGLQVTIHGTNAQMRAARDYIVGRYRINPGDESLWLPNVNNTDRAEQEKQRKLAKLQRRRTTRLSKKDGQGKEPGSATQGG